MSWLTTRPGAGTSRRTPYLSAHKPAPAARGVITENGSMASQDKLDKEKRWQQKLAEKKRRKEERKANSAGGGLENMMAYVDENGQITTTPPDPTKRKEIDISEIQIGVPRRTKEEETPEARTGKVDFFDTSKGFGFINEDGTRKRFFVHVSGLLDEVREGDKVTYDVERGQKGMNAVRVKKV